MPVRGVPEKCRGGDPASHGPFAAGPTSVTRALLATLAAVADTAALLYLRERLYAPD